MSVTERGPSATTMDTPATLRKHPASSPLTAEAHQPIASVRSISPSCALRSAPTSSPPSSQVSSTVYDDSPHWCILVTTLVTYTLSKFPGAGDVWFSLNGTTYQNNSNVVLEDIGSNNTDSLLCKTNLTACCRSRDSTTSLGNWVFPNGTTVGNANNGWDFYRRRGKSVVHMYRRRGGEEGIYHCKIPDSTNVIQNIYIGVYTASSGE